MDEAGRGPLAGPVVAAAVVFPAGVPRREFMPLLQERIETATATLVSEGRSELAGKDQTVLAGARASEKRKDHSNK